MKAMLFCIAAAVALTGCWSQPADDTSIGNIAGIRIRVPKAWVTGRVLYEGEDAVDPPIKAPPSFDRSIESIGFIIRSDKMSIVRSTRELLETEPPEDRPVPRTYHVHINAGVSPYRPDTKISGNRKTDLLDHLTALLTAQYVDLPPVYGLTHRKLLPDPRSAEALYKDAYYSKEYDTTIGCTQDPMITPTVRRISTCDMHFLDKTGKVYFEVYIREEEISEWLEIRKVALSFLDLVVVPDGGSNGH